MKWIVEHYEYKDLTVGEFIEKLAAMPQNVPFYLCGSNIIHIYYDTTSNPPACIVDHDELDCFIDEEYMGEDEDYYNTIRTGY